MQKLKQGTIDSINKIFGTSFEIGRFGCDTKGNLDSGFLCILEDKLHIQAKYDGVYVDLELKASASEDDIKDALSCELFRKREVYYNQMQQISCAIVKLHESM